MKSLIQKLDKTFALKDLGRLHYFLGIQIHYLESGFILNQAKYVDDLLHKLKLSDVKPIASPSVQGKLLSKTDGNPLDDLFIYRSIIGTLQYLTHTRPDIAYIVNHQVSSFNALLMFIGRLSKESCSTSVVPNTLVFFQSSPTLQVSTFSDAD